MKTVGKILCLFFLLSAISSCKKDSLSINEQNISRVKTYNDTLVSGENSNVKISAGKDRLYMTYGWGSAFWAFVNGIVYTGLTELTTRIISTDLNGELLWRATIPAGLSTTTPVELNDGSCVIAAANVWGYSPNVDQS